MQGFEPEAVSSVLHSPLANHKTTTTVNRSPQRHFLVSRNFHRRKKIVMRPQPHFFFLQDRKCSSLTFGNYFKWLLMAWFPLRVTFVDSSEPATPYLSTLKLDTVRNQKEAWTMGTAQPRICAFKTIFKKSWMLEFQNIANRMRLYVQVWMYRKPLHILVKKESNICHKDFISIDLMRVVHLGFREVLKGTVIIRRRWDCMYKRIYWNTQESCRSKAQTIQLLLPF